MYVEHTDSVKTVMSAVRVVAVSVALAAAVLGYAGIADTPAGHHVTSATEPNIIACPLDLSGCRRPPHPG
jgi:hypothetical protein